MNPIVHIKALKNRAEKGRQYYDDLLDEIESVEDAIRDELKNRRLDRKEACKLLEYNKDYIYNVDPKPPFNSKGYISYRDLERWTATHKPSRLKRLKRNYNQTLQ